MAGVSRSRKAAFNFRPQDARGGAVLLLLCVSAWWQFASRTTKRRGALVRFLTTDGRGGAIALLFGICMFLASWEIAVRSDGTAIYYFAVLATMTLTLAFIILGVDVMLSSLRWWHRVKPEAPPVDLSDEREKASRMDGRTCPRCGAVYYSSAPMCYSCSRMARSTKRFGPGSGKRIALFSVGLAMLIGGGHLMRQTLMLPAGEALSEAYNAFNGLVLVSVGTMIAAYSVLGRDTPLWRVREGARPRNKKAAALMSFGMGVFLYAIGYEAVCHVLGVVPAALMHRTGALAVSLVMIALARLRFPEALFAEDTGKEPGRLVRIATAVSVMLIGVGIAVSAMLSTVDPFVGSWVMIMGVLVFFVGVGQLFRPMMRPWLPGNM